VVSPHRAHRESGILEIGQMVHLIGGKVHRELKRRSAEKEKRGGGGGTGWEWSLEKGAPVRHRGRGHQAEKGKKSDRQGARMRGKRDAVSELNGGAELWRRGLRQKGRVHAGRGAARRTTERDAGGRGPGPFTRKRDTGDFRKSGQGKGGSYARLALRKTATKPGKGKMLRGIASSPKENGSSKWRNGGSLEGSYCGNLVLILVSGNEKVSFEVVPSERFAEGRGPTAGST